MIDTFPYHRAEPLTGRSGIMDLPIPLGLNELLAFAGINAPNNERFIY